MKPANADWLPGVHGAPGIQNDPHAFELLNRATDPNGVLTAAMWEVARWDGKIVLDLGAGTGHFSPLFAEKARHVFAVEPDDRLRLLAMERVTREDHARVSVMTGSAGRVFLPDSSVDIVHARFAYFWGPGCEPGLSEVARVVRPGGTAFIIDNDDTQGTFARWTGRSSTYAPRDQPAVERFWREQGFEVERVGVELRFGSREEFSRVVRNEFPAELAEDIVSEHGGSSLTFSYALLLFHRAY